MNFDDEGDKQLTIEAVGQIDEARELWKKLSPKKSIYDVWNFRYCFYKHFNYPLFFYVAKNRGEVVGLLPLQYNERKKLLEFFGGGYMEDNKIFVKEGYKYVIQELYASVQEKAKLEDIVGDDEFTQKLDILEHKYIANLNNARAVNDYFSTGFSSKSRSVVKKKIRRVETDYHPKIIENNFEDLERLFELNIKTFGNESIFCALFINIFRDLIRLHFDFHMITLAISGQKEAVSLSLMYGDTYVYMNAGTNKQNYPNLGTYLIAKNFEKAISLGSKYFDAGCEDLGWKERWHLDKIPQRFFVKG